MFIVRKSPMNRRYIELLFRLKFLPLLFLTYCPPWAVQSRRGVREHFPAAEAHLSVQQIAHPSMFPKAPLSNYTAPPGSLLRELYKSREGSVGHEAAFETSVTESAIPYEMHSVTEVLMHCDAHITSS